MFPTIQGAGRERPTRPDFSLDPLPYIPYGFKQDAELQSLTASDLLAIISLEDHAGGYPGVDVQYRHGIIIHINSGREASPEFKQYYKA